MKFVQMDCRKCHLTRQLWVKSENEKGFICKCGNELTKTFDSSFEDYLVSIIDPNNILNNISQIVKKELKIEIDQEIINKNIIQINIDVNKISEGGMHVIAEIIYNELLKCIEKMDNVFYSLKNSVELFDVFKRYNPKIEINTIIPYIKIIKYPLTNKTLSEISKIVEDNYTSDKTVKIYEE